MTPQKRIKIDVFTDYVCPWCYLSSANIEKLKQHYPVDIRWVPFPLHPETPEAGLSLQELFQGRNMDEMQQRLRNLMQEAGLDYSDRSMTYNSRLAQELGKWADTQAGGDRIHSALYRAYFVAGKNLADKDVLVSIAESVGLDADTARKVLDERSFSDQVDADWQRARQYQISGVPSFVASNYMMTGCQPYPELEKFVQFVAEKAATETG
ncbi:MAG: DsbA family oxidoreductase [Pseudomonadales bacterium]|nr:DsbA family oxidoreductase [Pseudomonadales bacterium]